MRHRDIPLGSLDLNLLLVLRELLRERNVTRAAERVGVTQPAVSAALSRLRRHFGDDLLIRVNRGYVLSPLAAQLERQVEEVCAAVEELFAAGARFNPATARREFTLLAADYTIAVLGERLTRVMADQAPHATLHLRLVRESLALDLPNVIRFIDGVISPPISPYAPPHLRSAELFTDRWVCVVWAHSPVATSDALTVADLARLPWVVPYHREPGYPSPPPVSRQLALLGIRPQVAVRVESYQAVPFLVTGTDRVALMQERLAKRFAEPLGLRMLECPGDPEPIVESLWWHEDFERDPAHAWFRDALIELARGL